MIVSDTKQGPLRVVIEAHGGALALFSPEIRTRIIKKSLKIAGSRWLTKWMPDRFTGYAYRIGYFVSNKWKAIKSRNGGSLKPFVGLTPTGGGNMTGKWWQRNREKMASAVRLSRVTASGKNGSEMVTMLVPFGHPIQTDKAKIFKTIAPAELEDMAQVFADALAEHITTGAMRKSGSQATAIRRIATQQRKVDKAMQRMTGGYFQRQVA